MATFPQGSFEKIFGEALVTQPVTAIHRDDAILVALSQLIERFRDARAFYFDEDAAQGPPFAILLAMFRDNACGDDTPMTRIVEKSDCSVATATYIVRHLINADYIVSTADRDGIEHFHLTHATEQAMRNYLRAGLSLQP